MSDPSDDGPETLPGELRPELGELRQRLAGARTGRARRRFVDTS